MEGDDGQYVLTNREFRKIYRRIMGDTKEQVNIRQAFTILNCSGRNVTSAHLQNQWKYLNEKISVDRLYDIYTKAEEVILEGHEYEKAVRTKTMRVEDVMRGLKDGSLVNRQYLEHVLEEYSNHDGFIEIGALLDACAYSRNQVVDKLLAPVVEEDYSEVSLKVRGYMTVFPTVQGIFFTVDVDQPTFCEFYISLANNSDVPENRFANDIFLAVFTKDRELVGLTRYVVEKNHKYTTGTVTVNAGDEVMIVGMGTTTNRKSSFTERAVLVEENNKLSKAFKLVLMNLFDSFDVDQDGLLNEHEMNFYTVAGGDAPLTEENWKDLYLDKFDNRDGGLTMSGFLKAHQTEADDGGATNDLWHTLHNLGYDPMLKANFGCSYDIEAKTSRPIRMIPRLERVGKGHRAFILENLYHLGEEDDRYDIRPRLFRTDYFGLLILKREEKFARDTYQISIERREDIRINFPHQVDQLIRLADSDSEWVLLASFTVTNPHAELEYTLQKVEVKSRSPSIARSQINQ